MRRSVVLFALSAGLVSGPGAACAMTAKPAAEPRCEVADAAKLPAGIGGADALCAAIRKAAAERGVAAGFSVQVRVESPYRISATARSADGRTFPEVNAASSDRPLSPRSFRMLGEAIAAQLSSPAR
jgi:hypothetical protein